MFLFIFLVFSCLVQSFAQLKSTGTCPMESVPPASDFNSDKLLGTWYETAHNDDLYQHGHKCTTFTYTAENEELAFRVHSFIEPSGGEFTWQGKLRAMEGASSGVFNLTFPQFATQKSGVVTFAGGDGNQWLLYHLCQVVNDERFQFISILSKTPDLDDKYRSDIDKITNKLEIPSSQLVLVNQKICPR